MDKSFARCTLAHAVAALEDPSLDDGDRRDAALTVGFVATILDAPTEAELTGVLRVAPRAFDDSVATEALLRALATFSADRDCLGASVAKLARRAFDDLEEEALFFVVVAMLGIAPWRRHLRDEWCAAAVAWTLRDWPDDEWHAGIVVRRALEACGAVPAWLRVQVEAFPELVASRAVSARDAWRLHAAAPSVAGWNFMFDRRLDDAVIAPASFGASFDVAVESLEQAIGEAPSEIRRIALARWLVLLRGSAS